MIARTGGVTLAPIDAAEINALRQYLRRRLRDPADVDDLMQDVYLRLLTTQASAVDHAAGYLRRIAANLMIDRHRRQVTRLFDRHLPLDDSIAAAGALGPDRAVAARQQLRRLDAALDALQPIARDTFLLVRVEGLSHKEAARRIGVTPKAVSHHVERTLARLADRLEMVE